MATNTKQIRSIIRAFEREVCRYLQTAPGRRITGQMELGSFCRNELAFDMYADRWIKKAENMFPDQESR